MRLGWNRLKQSGFDRGLYSDDPPDGTWSARIEQSAWADKKIAGIHLYLQHLSNGSRFWVFVPWARHELYEFFRPLADGSLIEVCTRARQGDRKPRLLSARALEPGETPQGCQPGMYQFVAMD